MKIYHLFFAIIGCLACAGCDDTTNGSEESSCGSYAGGGVTPATCVEPDAAWAWGVFHPNGQRGEFEIGSNVSGVSFEYLDLHVTFARPIERALYVVSTDTIEEDDQSRRPMEYDIFNKDDSGFDVAAFTAEGQSRGWHVDWGPTSFGFVVIQ